MDAVFTQQNGQPKIVRVLHPKTLYLKGSRNSLGYLSLLIHLSANNKYIKRKKHLPVRKGSHLEI